MVAGKRAMPSMSVCPGRDEQNLRTLGLEQGGYFKDPSPNVPEGLPDGDGSTRRIHHQYTIQGTKENYKGTVKRQF